MGLHAVRNRLYSVLMKLSKHTLKLSSETCSITLFIWVLAVSIVPNIWLSMTERLTVVQAIANVVFPLGLYIFLMSLSRHIGRTALWMVTVMFFAAFQMVLLYMYGRSVIAVDMFLNVVTTNPGEVGELLGNLLPIMSVVVVFYLFPIIMAIVAVVRKWRLAERTVRLTRRIGLWTSAAGILLVVAGFLQPGYNLFTDVFPLNAMYNVGMAVDRTIHTNRYKETSRDFSYEAFDLRPDSLPEIYVAVIGETSRADNWQLLGYDRPSNPLLSEKDGIVAFDKAITQSNTTHKSVPLLLSDLDADNFGDSIYVTKSLLTAFNEAGFRTAFISNQDRNRSFIDFFGEEADTAIFIRDYMPSDEAGKLDTNLLSFLDKELDRATGGKLLVVLHTYGSHFNYYDRYPRSMARFLPDGPVEASQSNRQELINAYDNSILQTDLLLASVIERLEARGGVSGMIYTSDHGEDVYDDSRRLFLHASPCPSYWQIHVPFLIWFSPQYCEAYPGMVNAASGNRGKFVASSQSYFHTLMEMAGVGSPRVNKHLSLVNRLYVPQPPRYLNDHNKSVTWEEAGLLPPDFHCLDSLLNCR